MLLPTRMRVCSSLAVACASRQPVCLAEESRPCNSKGPRTPQKSRVRRGPQPRPSQPPQHRLLSSSGPAAAAATSAAESATSLSSTGEDMPQGGHVPHRSIQVLNRYRALLLDSTHRPVGVANWQRAICLDLMDKAEVLEYWEGATVRSVHGEYFLPAVLRVRWHHGRNSHKLARVTLNRSNLMLRDRWTCQYCGSNKELTLDHVVPQSKGGGNTWENLVACCARCNSKKGSKSLKELGWKLRKQPKEPSVHELDFLLSGLLGTTSQDALPQEWQAYILPFQQGGKKSKPFMA